MTDSAAPANAARLRVAVLSRHFDPSAGGAERYAVALVQQLAPRHEIHVFAQSFGIDIAGVTAHRVSAWPRKPRWLNQLGYNLRTWWATRRGFDIVHSHESTWQGEVQTVHVRPVSMNLFVGRHGLRRALRWLSVLTSLRLWVYLGVERARLTASAHRAIVAVSPSLATELAMAMPRLAGHVDVVCPGVAQHHGAGASPAERLTTRQLYGVRSDVFLLLFVGNDHRKKGLPTALAAMASCDATVHLLVAGGAADVPASRRLVEQLDLADRVHFAGRVDDPAPLYRAADLLIHPALEDTFGMVVAEAMSHGLPTIVSPAPWCGMAAELRPGIDAWVLPDPHDVAAAAKGIQQIRGDAALRTALAEAGPRHVARYAWPLIARQQEEIYRRVLRAKTQPATQATS